MDDPTFWELVDQQVLKVTSDTKETFSTEEIVEGLTMCPDCEKELRKYVKSKGHCCLACAVNKYLDKEYEPMKK